MALATESANKVWQRVKIALANANPASQRALLELKHYLAQQKGNPDLQFIPFAAEDCTTNLGTMILDNDAAYTIYAVYIKARRTSGTTASFFAIHDADDNSATTTTLVTALINLTGQEYALIFPSGLVGAADIAVSSASAVGGATESSAANSVDGFVIVGA